MMRAAALGVAFRNEPVKRVAFNRIQTRLTHTDPKAEFCSRAIVELAAHFSQDDPDTSLEIIFTALNFPDADSSFCDLLESIRSNIECGESLPALLESLGANPRKGVSGYCYHTLAAVIHCGHTHQWNPETALPAI